MSQLSALRRTVKELKKAGKLNESHAALLAIAEGMATALDNPTKDNPNTAALWKEYRAALLAVVEAGANVEPQRADIVALVRTPLPPPLGDAKDA